MVAWSYDLLPPETRGVFARLGVFSSSLTLEAAEAVCADEMHPRDVLDHITTLVDHSLLAREPGPAPTSRYRLLETLRLFALSALADAGVSRWPRGAPTPSTSGAWRRRRARRPTGRTSRCGEAGWRPRSPTSTPRWRGPPTHDPARACELAVALWPYWDMRWGERDGGRLPGAPARPPRTLAGDDRLRAWGLTVAADLAANPGDARRSLPWAREAVDLFRRSGDEHGLACALVALGSALGNQGALDEAAVVLDEAMVVGPADR